MRRAIAASALCVFLAVPALADFQVWKTSVDPSLLVDVVSSGYDGPALAGIYNLTIDGSAALDGTGVQAFCIDIWDAAPLRSDNALYNAVPLSQAPDPGAAPIGGMGNVKAAHLVQLLDAWWGAPLQASSPNVQAAAIQVAVWEIVDELAANSYNVTSGQFYASGDAEAVALATTMLGSVDLSNSDVDLSGYLALTSTDGSTGEYTGLGNYQDFVVKVPVPAAFVLGLLGLGVAGTRLRKHA